MRSAHIGNGDTNLKNPNTLPLDPGFWYREYIVDRKIVKNSSVITTVI